MRLAVVILALTLLLIVDLSAFGGHYTIGLIAMAQQSFHRVAQHFGAR